jgi:hypothetical protein
MLAMSEVNCIKVLRNQKSLSINAIPKTMGINWRTAKKYADGEDLPKEKTGKKEGMMHEERWGEIVADWLWEDEKLKKKQRRTNKKIFQDLKAMAFPGSYRTICYFIKEWRESREDLEEETRDKNAERLELKARKTISQDGHAWFKQHLTVWVILWRLTGFMVLIPRRQLKHSNKVKVLELMG